MDRSMKTAIHKYPIRLLEQQTVTMPLSANILCAQMQNRKLCIWAKVDSDESQTIDRTILIFGTGNPMPMAHGDYIDTVQVDSFVWHVFAHKQ